jgi:hypothetical protein
MPTANTGDPGGGNSGGGDSFAGLKNIDAYLSRISEEGRAAGGLKVIRAEGSDLRSKSA